MSTPPDGSPRSKLTALVRGCLLPGRAARFVLRQPGLKRHLILPLLVTAVVYLLVWTLLLYLLWNWDVPEFGPWEFLWGLGRAAAWLLNHLAEASKWLVGVPLILMISYFTFTIVGMLVASPFNDLLSERVERAVKATPRQANETGPLTGMVRSTAHSAWLAGRQGLGVLATLPLLLVPVVGVVPLFVVTAYFAGLGFFDVPAARHGLRHQDRQALLRRRRTELLGLGIAMELLFWIPFLGLLLLPFGVVAGTLLYCDDTSDPAADEDEVRQ